MTVTRKRWIAGLMSCCLMATAWLGALSVQAEETAPAVADGEAVSDSDITEAPSHAASDSDATEAPTYLEYYNAISQLARPAQAITLAGASAVAGEAGYVPEIQEYDGQSGVLLSSASSLTWTFQAAEAGVYSLYVTYYTVPGKDTDITLSVALDGQTPYDKAESFVLQRIWKDELTENGEFKKDAAGSDLRPQQVEVYRWEKAPFIDSQGLYEEPYLFYLEAGTHVISLATEQQSVVIGELSFANQTEAPTYEQYRQSVQQNGTAGNVVRKEAEFADEKNNRILYPTYDHADASTLPNDPYNIKLNSIGQSNWSVPGDYITWELNEITEAGWYQLYFRVKQSYNSNSYSYRKLKINGEVPFKEAECIDFYYKNDWYVQALQNDTGELLSVYLEPGDVLTLECVSDVTSKISRNLNQSILDLNAIYRQIIVITGTSPDIYRDYSLESQLPNMISDFREAYEALAETADLMVEMTGSSGPSVSTINEMLEILEKILKDPYTVPEYLTNLKDGIQNLGSLLQTVGKQPLELDCFYFVPEGMALPETELGFWAELSFSVNKFVSSFVNDYDLSGGIGATSRDVLAVWVSTGRDQMQLISNMIEDSFTQTYGTKVKLSLVDTGNTLIQATLAGKGPDVAISIPTGTPINLAMRGALVDLTAFDLSELDDQFYPESWTPYEYNGGIYAIPETQSFEVLFYRTDILKELGLTPPQTWDEFYDAVRVIQSVNLDVGILEVDKANPGVSAGIGAFTRFLLQRGGRFYNDEHTKTEFDQKVAYEAFEEWVDLYKVYGFNRDFDFFNLFRSGEMPMGISGYGTYNQLMAAAPEIRGLWAFVEVPGILQADGTINRAESSAGTACMMMNSAVNKGLGQQALDFMKWWAGAETQARYARELEAVMGVAARYAPANIQAFEQMNWTEKEMQVLRNQWSQVINIPEIPGNYVVPRALTNAFRKAYNETGSVQRQLDIYNKTINDEILWKRKEFHLD